MKDSKIQGFFINKWPSGMIIIPLLILALAMPHFFTVLVALPKDVAADLNKYPFTEQGIGYDTTNPLVDLKGESFSNIRNLNKIVLAIYKYENENKIFPVGVGGSNTWNSPVKYGDNWIEGLVPKYIDTLPEDIRKKNNLNYNFLYISDGFDFKLIASNPPDCSKVKDKYPELIDPKRECKAYGYWTKKWRYR